MTKRHMTSITFEIGKTQKWYEIDYKLSASIYFSSQTTKHSKKSCFHFCPLKSLCDKI